MTSMTAEQEIEQKALDRAAATARSTENAELQQTLHTAAAADAVKHAKVTTRAQAIQTARDLLIENSRSKAVDERDITAAALVAYADTITAYVLGDEM